MDGLVESDLVKDDQWWNKADDDETKLIMMKLFHCYSAKAKDQINCVELLSYWKW